MRVDKTVSPRRTDGIPGRDRSGRNHDARERGAECDLGFEGESIYTVVVYSSTAQQSDPLEVAPDQDGSFSSEISVPASFTPGTASVIVTGSPYDDCGDETGSCAQYSVDVTITR